MRKLAGHDPGWYRAQPYKLRYPTDSAVRLRDPVPVVPPTDPSPSPPPWPAGQPRAALVTGAAQRVGRAIALALAADGWDVAVHFHGSADPAQETVRQVRALGRRAQACCLDLASGAGLDALFDAAAAGVGPIGCLVNNASLFHHDGVADFSTAALEAHMRVNVAAPVLLARALHARLREAERGVVVNVLDQKLWNPNPDFLSYTLSKSALEAATGLLARALAPRLRVVGVAPGLTLPAPGQTPAGFQAAHAATPLGASSTPEDIGHAVAYLCCAAAVTGTTLLVDGGQHLVPSARDIMFLKG